MPKRTLIRPTSFAPPVVPTIPAGRPRAGMVGEYVGQHGVGGIPDVDFPWPQTFKRRMKKPAVLYHKAVRRVK